MSDQQTRFISVEEYEVERSKDIRRLTFLRKILAELSGSDVSADRYYWTCNLKEYLELKELTTSIKNINDNQPRNQKQ